MFVDRSNGVVSGVYAVRQYDGQEEIADDHAEVVAFQTRVPVPQRATSGDFVAALCDLGWYDAVEAAATAAGGKTAALWKHASVFERQHPIVRAIAQAIGKTDADLDALFIKTTTYS